jgi:superfamily II DNA or RNA helicase
MAGGGKNNIHRRKMTTNNGVGATMLKSGLYEQLISEQLREELNTLVNKETEIERIDEAESTLILSKYLGEIVQKALSSVREDKGDVHSQVQLINRIISLVDQETEGSNFSVFKVDESGEQLLSILDTVHEDGAITKMVRPDTSISLSSLFTGSTREPSMYSELKKEILSSNRVDMLVSFIRWSGLRMIMDELRAMLEKGGSLRVVTTPYIGATDLKAIKELSLLPNTEIKITYDTKSTRLHAKAHIFHRNTGFTTAYVGSSNLSNAAISSGLEWNVKLAKKDLPETVAKMEATFESYWNSPDFETYTPEEEERLRIALKKESNKGMGLETTYDFDIRPYTYQEEILQNLDAERNVKGHMRNLVVAATGTGKTVISAFDYKRFKEKNPQDKCRLLFIAHREEILKQSLACFRGVLRDQNFGELFVGNHKPEDHTHLFMSIQTFNSQKWDEKTSAEFYDYIVMDEIHHSPAKSYQKLLTYYKPKILLGLTATPERMDGLSVTAYFDHRIAAEIRLPEAIERRLLSPFQYFGVTDNVDLSDMKWSKGGYDKKALSNVYTLNRIAAQKRAQLIVTSVKKYVNEISDVTGLGFCVSIKHAKFMAEFFSDHGIPSMYLVGISPEEERENVKAKLTSGEVNFVFVVDIFNEGVDIPQLNTVLFLRPTDSLTVFLQQLGRGLRLYENKECLTVLDFIGQAHKKYRFENKFKALLSDPCQSIQKEIKNGFTSVPKGCFIQLEKIAQKYVLESIKNNIGSKTSLIYQMRTFEEDTGQELIFSNFLHYYNLTPRDIYRYETFSRLMATAIPGKEYNEPIEEISNRAFSRLSFIDSRRWINFLLEITKDIKNIDIESFTEKEKRMFRMFYCTLWDEVPEDLSKENIRINLIKLSDSPVLLGELRELLEYNFDHIDFVDKAVDLGFECPMDVYCNYTRDQILAAMDYWKPAAVRQGVLWLPTKKTDIFFVTLNKTEKEYSESTMYEDYSISESKFHWQSQSTTSDTSPTGIRYINHKKKGSNILLFVRENIKEKTITSSYTFLGLAKYISHEGSKPMSILFQLEEPIPPKYLKKTNKLVVG